MKIKHAIKITLVCVLLFHPISFSETNKANFQAFIKSLGQGCFIKDVFDTIQKENEGSSADRNLRKAQIGSSNTIWVLGNCYEGTGTNVPIDTGSMVFFVLSTSTNDYPAQYRNWNAMGNGAMVSKGGKVLGAITVSQKGQYYILINPYKSAKYAMQWWDGKQITEQPVPVDLTTDTIHNDFHLNPECSFSSKIPCFTDSNTESTRPVIDFGLIDNDGLYIFPPVAVDPSYPFVAFANVPTGTYYLRHGSDAYGNCFYNNTNQIGNATGISFSQFGTRLDTVSWILTEKPITSNAPMADVTVKYVDSLGTDYNSLLYYNSSRYFSYFSTSNDTFTTKVFAGKGFFLSRVIGAQTASNMRVYYYPGTFFRAEAETLSVKQGDHPAYSLHFPLKNIFLSYSIPVFSDSQLSFNPILSNYKQMNSLGASPNIASSNTVRIAVKPGLYSLQNVPTTDGYKYAEGWSSKKIDSINVDTLNGPKYLPAIQSTWNTHSIEGTSTCNQNPIFVCFDSLGFPVSFTKIDIYKFFRQKIGPRARFFYFDMVAEKPYSVSFYLNFLNPGKYAVAKVEPPDSVIGDFSVSWYGGPTQKLGITMIDDIAGIKLPSQITWVTVDSNNTITKLQDWSTARQQRLLNPAILTKYTDFQVLPNGVIKIYQQSRDCRVRFRIFNLNGRLLGVLNVKKNDAFILDKKYMNQPLFIEMDNGRKVIKKALICR
jgi:hypothetical protein